ncbi:MAG: tetratricopeptide repeat protein [Bacteroidales bacterium]|jgi:Tfp pilus assembly protein PilF|nr:tetratricopeptide repeat protein [Bacteroidales bacterium]
MKKKVFAVWYVFAFSLIITAHAPADDQAKAFMDRGITFYYKGDYVTAIADFTDAFKLDPNNTAAYINRGASYFHKEDYVRAIADCTRAISIDPNRAAVWYQRGTAYLEKGDGVFFSHLRV